jgi:hypothetical protein
VAIQQFWWSQVEDRRPVVRGILRLESVLETMIYCRSDLLDIFRQSPGGALGRSLQEKKKSKIDTSPQRASVPGRLRLDHPASFVLAILAKKKEKKQQTFARG